MNKQNKPISLIAAVAHNNVLGSVGTIPWHIPEDFAYFKKKTLGKPIIMGVSGDASNLVTQADCGVCFKPEDSVALAEASKSLALLDSFDIQRLGKNAEKFYDENLSVKVGVDSFEKVFNEAINIKQR